MTVKELIEELQQYPPNMEVWAVMPNPSYRNIKRPSLPSAFGDYVEPIAMLKASRIKKQHIVRRPCKETAGAKKVLVIY